MERAAEALRDAWEFGRAAMAGLCDVLEDHGVRVALVETDSRFGG